MLRDSKEIRWGGLLDCSLQESVHLWRVNFGADQLVPAQAWACLNATERVRALSFRFARDRERFVSRRVALRMVLARYLGVLPEKIEFQAGAHGKPELAGPLTASGWTFNASHSGDYALIAVARGRCVGVDIEQHRELRDLPDLLPICLSPAEHEVFFRHPVAERSAAFFRCWTRKEAFLKALGWGLAFPMTRCTVAFAATAVPAVLVAPVAVGAAATWGMQALAVAPGYSAALVTRPREFALQCFDFPTLQSWDPGVAPAAPAGIIPPTARFRSDGLAGS